MPYSEDLNLLEEYNTWVAEKKATATDLTPDAFMADRVKRDAADRLIKALGFIEGFGEWNEATGNYREAGANADTVRFVEGILRGEI